MFRSSLLSIAIVCGLAGALGGCAGVVVGGGAVVAGAAMEERGLSSAAEDAVTHARVSERLVQHSGELYRKVGIEVNEGRVLLTGQVKTQQMRLEAVRLVWRAAGVKEVINQIQVTDKSGIADYARDSWVTTQLVSKLLFDKHVQSINYNVETVGGIVYLMGIAQDQAELDRVTNHARNLSYVRKVVSFVLLKDDPRRNKS